MAARSRLAPAEPTALRASVMALGFLAHRFTPGGGNKSVPIRHRYRHAEVPSRRTLRCCAQSTPISTVPPGLVRVIAKYGRGCACLTAFELPASGCCG